MIHTVLQNQQITYDGLTLDSLDFANTVGGVDISIMEVTGVVAKGVDVFFPVGVSLSPQGERLPMYNKTIVNKIMYIKS